MRIIGYSSIKWREGLHTVTLLPGISETVVELSIMLFSLIFNILFLCVGVFYVLMHAFLYSIVSQINFCPTSLGIPQEILE
jgi:ABC-type Na+ efflux pump permease subunit